MTRKKTPETSAMYAIGRHLLGRKPHPGDPSDWKMGDYLTMVPDRDFSPFEGKTLEQLSETDFINVWEDVLAFWRWWKTYHSNPTPTPPPSPSVHSWQLKVQLDQGQTGHCVGFGTTAWRNADPVPNKLTNAEGHKFYYDCKVLDGQPGAEDGSYVHTAAKLLKQRGEIGGYVWATSMDDLVQWVSTKSPVVAGTDWDGYMFTPGVDGYVTPGGGVAGGHCYLFLDYLPDEDAFLCDNSWGPNWGLSGRFKMKVADTHTLMSRAGAEFMAGIETPA